MRVGAVVSFLARPGRGGGGVGEAVGGALIEEEAPKDAPPETGIKLELGGGWKPAGAEWGTAPWAVWGEMES